MDAANLVTNLNNESSPASKFMSLLFEFPIANYKDSWHSFLLEADCPQAAVRLEGKGHLKNPMTSPGIKPATFWLVA
jgi:hypothetical protein